MSEETAIDENVDEPVRAERPADVSGFREVGPLWVNTDMYADLVDESATIAFVERDLDRPGGGELSAIDRHGDQFLLVDFNSDVFEYLGEFPTNESAIKTFADSKYAEGAVVRAVR